MFIDTLTDHEIEALIVVLKYWRRHRRDTDTRWNDPVLTRDAVDLMLAKLTSASTALSPSGDPDAGAHLLSFPDGDSNRIEPAPPKQPGGAGSRVPSAFGRAR
jgi:hypothetical protein